MDTKKSRNATQVLKGVPAMDGAGVKLTRIIGTPELNMFDPFLLFDVFESENPDDYIAGFPAHPHRGFETFTWLIEGRMRHEDDTGNGGVIRSGGGQWMNAGRGIIHSEMPEQEDGLLKGVQIWINLPRADKMNAPSYVDLARDTIPREIMPEGAKVGVLVGSTQAGTAGPVQDRPTEPLFLDVCLEAGGEFNYDFPDSHNVIAWVASGAAETTGETGPQQLESGSLAIFAEQGTVSLIGATAGTRLLVAAGKRLGEPVARGGPFVMNTKEEVVQAFKDFESGALGGGFYIPGGVGDPKRN